MSYATLNGSNIFGYATQLKMVQHPAVQQINEFFGVDGLFSLYGGQRGRYFLVKSWLYGANIADLNAAETIWDTSQPGNIGDGVARTLVTPRGVVYSHVIYKGEYDPDDSGPHLGACPAGYGFLLHYNAVLHGLS